MHIPKWATALGATALLVAACSNGNATPSPKASAPASAPAARPSATAPAASAPASAPAASASSAPASAPAASAASCARQPAAPAASRPRLPAPAAAGCTPPVLRRCVDGCLSSGGFRRSVDGCLAGRVRRGERRQHRLHRGCLLEQLPAAPLGGPRPAQHQGHGRGRRRHLHRCRREPLHRAAADRHRHPHHARVPTC